MAKIDDCLIDTAVVVSVFESEGKEIIVKKKAFVFAPAVTINIPSFFTPTFSSTPSFPDFFPDFSKLEEIPLKKSQFQFARKDKTILRSFQTMYASSSAKLEMICTLLQ